MASTKILNAKKEIVAEITDKVKNSESVIVFQYQGLTVDELSELRKKLREVKDDDEIQNIRKACEITDACFEYLKNFIKI